MWIGVISKARPYIVLSPESKVHFLVTEMGHFRRRYWTNQAEDTDRGIGASDGRLFGHRDATEHTKVAQPANKEVDLTTS